MTAEILARVQFVMTVGFHYIFPPINIGMAWIIFALQCFYLKTNDVIYHKISKFWIKLFGITFAVGVATGITMEFQFGTNWAAYSRFVGDIFGAPLAAEGVLAFFLESSFLGILLYGEKKVSSKVYALSSLMVALGSTLSAFWIIVANSWQQTPTGFQIVNGRAELIDFWAAVFNPSTLPRYFHTMSAAIVTGAFFMAGIAAFYLWKKQHKEFALRSITLSLIFGLVASIIVAFMGHWHAVQVAQTQPAKLAAMEGLWETHTSAPLLIFGIPNVEQERTDFAIEIPGALSFLVSNKFDHTVQGLKDFPKEERPPVLLPFFSFHLMVGLGTYFILVCASGLFLIWRKVSLFGHPLMPILFFSIPLPILANEFGWIAAEVGRQPWIVYGILKTRDALSVSVPKEQILMSIIMFAAIYSLLFVAWIFLLRFQIKKGPEV